MQPHTHHTTYRKQTDWPAKKILTQDAKYEKTFVELHSDITTDEVDYRTQNRSGSTSPRKGIGTDGGNLFHHELAPLHLF